MAELYGYPVTGPNGLPHGGSIIAKKLGSNWGATKLDNGGPIGVNLGPS